MGRETRLFKTQERKSRQEAAAFLRQLADRLDGDGIVLRQGTQEIRLQPPAWLTLEVQVEDEDKGTRGVQHSLEVELKWFDGDEQAGEGGGLELG